MSDPSLPSLRVSAPLRDVFTERLELRRLRAADLSELTRIFAVLEVWQYPYGRGLTPDETETFLTGQIEAWESLGFGLWLASERASGRVVGFVGLSVPTFLPEILPAVEVGWRLHPEAWGRGLASEGARAALREGFETLGLEEICSVPQADNAASVRVCERIGMDFVRTVEIPANDRRGALEARLYRSGRPAVGR